MTPSFEDLLADALVANDLEGPPGLERVLAAHPQHAAQLRAHLQRLRGFGLVAEQTQLAPPSRPPGAFPEQLGEFRLLHRLGGGGMGVVFLAEQTSLRRRVALKLVRSENLFYPGAHERFRREVEAIAKLAHPGIVPVYGAGEDAGIPWLAMEHVEGASLDQVVAWLAGRDPARLTGTDLQHAVTAIVARRAASVPAAADRAPTPAPASTSEPFASSWTSACLRIARDVALALQHAHERGVLHRDVKPSNVMLTLDGRALLLDFGLALADDSARLTRSGAQLGTPAYMSPEQMRGDSAILDARTDVYSLGVTLYELLTLRMPFLGDSAASTRDLVLAGRPAPLRLLNRTIPRDADVVCRCAMDVEPARRYAGAAAFAADLENVLTQHPVRARPPNAFTVTRRWAQRHPAVAVAIVAGLLLFVATPIAFAVQQQSALAAVREQRDRAKVAVDTMLRRVADESLFEVPRMLSLRRDLLDSARSLYEQLLADARDDAELREQAAETQLSYARAEMKLGQYERAFAAITRAEQLHPTRATETASGHVLVRHLQMAKATCLQTRARLPESLVALHEARTHCLATLETAPGDGDAWTDRMSIERALALVHRQLQNHDEAAACLRELLTLSESVLAHTADTALHGAALDEVLCALGDAAEIHFQDHDGDNLQDVLLRTEEVQQEVALSELASSTQLAIARIGATRARFLASTGRTAEAERSFRGALDVIARVLVDFPDYALGLRARASVCNDFAVFLAADDRTVEAKPLLEQSIATLRRLLAIDPSVPENRANLAASLANVGGGLLDAGDAKKARELFAEAAELARGAVAAAPTRDSWRLIARNAEWFLAQACGALGDHAAEAAAAERMVAVMPADAHTQRIAGGLLVEAIGSLGRDGSLAAAARDERRRAFAQRAIEMLREAARLGCTDAQILRGEYFAALQPLPGFAEVVARMQANAEGATGGK